VRSILTACALLAAVPARAEEFAPRFLEPRARAGVFVLADLVQLPSSGAGPMLSAAVIVNQLIVVDLSGLYLPGPVGFGALQVGPMLRLGARGPEGAGLTLDLRAMLGGAVATQRTSSGSTLLALVGLSGVALEGTKWFGRSWGLSGDLAANLAISSDSDPGLLVRISVGLAF